MTDLRVAIDTSVLVADVLAWHDKHEGSHQELERLRASGTTLVLPSHALIESYSVLTRLPAPKRLAPGSAIRMLQESFGTWTLAGSTEDTWNFLRNASESPIAGGTIHDALIIESALAAGADELVTWNIKHFERVAGNRLSIRAPEN